MSPLQFTRNVQSLNRLRRIAQVLTRHGFGHIVTRMHLGRFVPVWMWRRSKSERSNGVQPASVGHRIAMVCGELGPTFVKLGQVLSTRPDLIPEDVLKELRGLQDEVPPFDTQEALTTIERELGRPVGACFSSIEPQPFASASIGQAYRAEGKKGEQLVVKVRRPDIENMVRLDMHLMHWLARSVEDLMPELRIFRPTMIVSELEQMLRRELDYVNEAAATTRFYDAFQQEPGIHVPRVHWELSGKTVLTLDAIPGTNVETLLRQDPAVDGDVDRRLIASRLADCFLKQALEVGMFHADPHPGNILIQPPATIGLVDFGQVGTITESWMTELVIIVYACVQREVDIVIDALADLGAFPLETDRHSLHRSLTMLLDKYYGLPIRRFDIATLFTEFSEIMRRHDATIPRDLVLLVKSFSTASTVIARLDPDLDLLALLKPRLRRALSERLSPKAVGRGTALAAWHLVNIVRSAPAQLRQGLRRLVSGGWRLDVRHENIDRLIGELDRSSNRLAFSVVIAAIIVGSSVVVSAPTDLTLLGFMRVQYLGILGYVVAGILGLGLSWAIFRSGRLH